MVAMKRTAAVVLLGVGLASFTPALAAGGGGEGEGGDGEAAPHITYTGDDDGDGVPNWRDPQNHDGKNEAYVVPGILQHAFNLAILVGIGLYAGRRPIADALRNREGTIREELAEAARLRDEARKEHEALAQRLAAFESEVAAMNAKAEEDAAHEEQRLLERANEAAARIEETAQRNIREEVTRAKVALRREAVDLAVQLAEQTLTAQVGADDQRRLARQFLDSLSEDAHGRS